MLIKQSHTFHLLNHLNHFDSGASHEFCVNLIYLFVPVKSNIAVKTTLIIYKVE